MLQATMTQSTADPKKELSHADLHVMVVVIALAYGRSTSHTTAVATSCQLSGGQWRPIDGAIGVAVARCPSARRLRFRANKE